MVALAQTGTIERMLQGHNGSFAPDVAREILGWRFAESDQSRVTELSEKARTDTATPDELRELDWYLLLGDFLSILQSKARIALQRK